MKSFFTPKEVCEITKISYRQVQYWDKTNFIRPSYRRRGKYRLYTFSDLIKIWLAAALRDRAYSIQTLRKIIVKYSELVPTVAHPLVDLTISVDGNRVLIFDGTVIGNTTGAQMKVASLREKVNTLYPEQLQAA